MPAQREGILIVGEGKLASGAVFGCTCWQSQPGGWDRRIASMGLKKVDTIWVAQELRKKFFSVAGLQYTQEGKPGNM
jgi:hypothetical protein